MILKHHIPLRSNMPACLLHARNGESRHIPTRTQVISKVKADRKRAEARVSIAEYREKLMPKRLNERIANVKCLPKSKTRAEAEYKVVGIADTFKTDKASLELLLKSRGYTGIRWGHLPSVKAL